jgi:hypothetical protein
MKEQGGWFVRFQDTPCFEENYSSQHSLFNELSGEIKDERIIELYTDDSSFRLKSGYVFAFSSNADTDEEYEDEASQSEGQVNSDDFAVFLTTDGIVYNLGDMGYVVNLKECEIKKVISRK